LARPVGTGDRLGAIADARAQVRLFLVAPIYRRIHHPPPGRRSLRDFDHVKLNCERQFCDRQSTVGAPASKGSVGRLRFICGNWPILTSDLRIRGAGWFHRRPASGDATHDRLPRRNPAARNAATPLPEMSDPHDAWAHLARADGIRPLHVRLLQMRSCREDRYRQRSDEVRRCWLAR
jgi:hypothetical protein